MTLVVALQLDTKFPGNQGLDAATVQSLSSMITITSPTRLKMQRIHFYSPLILATTECINTSLRDSTNPGNDAEAPFSHLRPRKRRRLEMPLSHGSTTPTQPRVDHDEPITRTQSTSVVESITSVTSLTEKATLI
ncbi:hypothetical protein BU23DRAFT_648653 [Bimuria novae-zelandiae CBS 107.79]|uniref:Uncharacterized protein n=1 Tax=Bimuria novae-zelandiae CBS 107.79 TaxID=1447943 RepID=A0A6A5V798_9PLEO|nr:hypothetical protein BU23DRAFT_648653 [Bimuria novae-zelandiae CBS 107.79]